MEKKIEETNQIVSTRNEIRERSVNSEYLENWIFRYQFTFGLFCKSRPPEKLIKDYLLGLGNEGVIPLQEWCINNSLISWVSGINMIDAVDMIVINKD